jgi:cobalt-zinc-cadmium efflux system protein
MPGGDRRLAIAIAVNVLLTVAQVIGGVLSGSLALVADAIHNLSDAAALAIARIARGSPGNQPTTTTPMAMVMRR